MANGVISCQFSHSMFVSSRYRHPSEVSASSLLVNFCSPFGKNPCNAFTRRAGWARQRVVWSRLEGRILKRRDTKQPISKWKKPDAGKNLPLPKSWNKSPKAALYLHGKFSHSMFWFSCQLVTLAGIFFCPIGKNKMTGLKGGFTRSFGGESDSFEPVQKHLKNSSSEMWKEGWIMIIIFLQLAQNSCQEQTQPIFPFFKTPLFSTTNRFLKNRIYQVGWAAFQKLKTAGHRLATVQ